MAHEPGYSFDSVHALTPVSGGTNLPVLDTPFKSSLPRFQHLLRIVSKDGESIEQPAVVDDHLLFQEVFDEHYRALLYYAKCFVSDVDTARDVVQEVFSNFWLKRESIREKKAIKSFLYVSTRNKCIDFLRHAKLKHENEQRLSYFLDTEKKTEHLSDLEVEVTAASTLTLIHKAIEELPDKYKDVVRLSFYENLSLEEIASRLQLPYKTVYTQKNRAIERLKETFVRHSLLLLFIIVYQVLK
jgi:RNA polymerase sigma-70 factor (ECF subfamily)